MDSCTDIAKNGEDKVHHAVQKDDSSQEDGELSQDELEEGQLTVHQNAYNTEDDCKCSEEQYNHAKVSSSASNDENCDDSCEDEEDDADDTEEEDDSYYSTHLAPKCRLFGQRAALPLKSFMQDTDDQDNSPSQAIDAEKYLWKVHLEAHSLPRIARASGSAPKDSYMSGCHDKHISS